MTKKMKLAEQKTDLKHLKTEKRNLGKQNVYSEQRRNSLVARLKSSDHRAAAELVDLYYEQIYLFMRRLGHDRQTSEDLTQESFLNAWHHIGQLRDGNALNGWLYRIAGNLSKLYWRKHKNKEVAGIELLDIPDSNNQDYDKISHREQLENLKNTVSQLPWKLRQVIVLHYMQELSISEAAEAAEIREGTFKSRLHRALEALRKSVI